MTFPESRDIARLREKDIWFDFFWRGGMFSSKYHLVLKRQVATIQKGDKFITLYNERPYRKPRKGCLPPKFIRMQGRSAHSRPSLANNKPLVRDVDEDGNDLVFTKCPCGGELVYDRNEYLYCLKCGLIHNTHPIGYLQFADLIHARGARGPTYTNWWVEIDDWYDP